MTDRPNHRAAAERMLADADEWTAQAEEPTPEAGELSCLAYAAVHALLAIHDTLTAADRYKRQRKAEPDPPDDGAAATLGIAGIRYVANESEAAEWLALDEDEDDPLDEDDHRDRVLSDGGRIIRNGQRHWHTPLFKSCPDDCGSSLSDWNRRFGPLAFAPEPPQEATGDDQSASESVGGPVEGPATDNAQKAILCPECDHHIHTHDMDGCLHILCCPRTPEDVARALINLAVKTAREADTDG